MIFDTFMIEPLEEPEHYFAEFLANMYVPDTVRPQDNRWIVPIDFQKLGKILDGE